MLPSWMNTARSLVLLDLVWGLVWGLVWQATSTAWCDSAPQVLNAWREDADLHDVHFVDADYGWAVGDHGTIWHTQNGGEIWRQQTSSVTASLRSVHFVDRLRGYAVGGTAIPLTEVTQGIVLKTEDGGKNWNAIDGLLLPWISKVHFSSSQHGVAVGDASSTFPTGAWTTRDGGRTWSPVLGERGVHWLHADLAVTDSASSSATDAYVGLLLGHDGRIARLSNGRLSTVAQPSSATPWPRHACLSVLNANVSFAGTHGLDVSADGGRSWQSVGRFQPSGLPFQMHWRSLALQDNHAWLAGSPGTRIVRSTDFGQTWIPTVAPSTMPLYRLQFVSPLQGWAVGAKGTILSTKDGGQSWSRQRAGTKRDALLGVFADQRDIPWDLIAQASAVDEYRTHLVLVARSHDSTRSSLVHRLQHAAMQVGATAEVLTPEVLNASINLPPKQLIANWETQQPDALDWLGERITRLIRARRPDVVLSSEWSHHGNSTGAQRLVSQLVADACDYAESEHAFSEQLQNLGLVPWHVSRVLTCSPQLGTAGPLSSKRTTGLGRSAEELAQESRRILDNAPPITGWSLRSLRADLAGDLGTQPFAGVVVEYGSAARRDRPAPHGPTNRAHLALALARAGGGGLQRVEQIETLSGGDSVQAGKILFDLAEEEQEPAQRSLLLWQLVSRHPDHPLAAASLQQLIQHHTSLEQQWRAYQQQATSNPEVSLLADATEQETNPDGGVQLASAESPTFQADWSLGLRLLQEVNARYPTLSNEPEIAFPLATLSRQPTPSAAARWQNHVIPNGWPFFAKLEMLLVGATKGESQPSSVWSCQASATRPFLDGELSDEIWKTTEFQSLHASPQDDPARPPTMIGIAKDERYLYLAAYCPKRSGVDYAPIRKQRPRDGDVSQHDRVRFRFDINRDYVSWWSLTFDDRGWTNDGLNDDLSWNPSYFVAAKSDEQIWVIEAAIPLNSLAPDEYQRGTYWAIGVERIVPDMHAERWHSSGSESSKLDLQGLLYVP